MINFLAPPSFVPIWMSDILWTIFAVLFLIFGAAFLLTWPALTRFAPTYVPTLYRWLAAPRTVMIVWGFVLVTIVMTVVDYWFVIRPAPPTPPYFTHIDARAQKQATDKYYVTISVRNTTNGMVRDLVSQMVVMDQFLGQRQDAILNDNNDPHPWAAQLGPQTTFTFIGEGLNKRDVMQPFFAALWLRYIDARTSRVCTQADYYVFRGFKPTARLEPATPEDVKRIEAYLTEQDRLLFPLPAKDCLS